MTRELSSLVWSLLGYYRRLIQEMDISHNPREALEAIRLAALNSAIAAHQGLGPDAKLPRVFNRLSYQGQMQVSSKSTIMRVQSNLPAGKEDLMKSLQSLSLNKLVDCLGLIHSMGCFRLPLAINHSTAQRQLGAFYTPSDVADFIVSLALGPFLDRIKDLDKNSIQDEISRLRILDPACGTGVFLLASARRLNAFVDGHLESVSVNYVPCLCGVDLDSGALEVAEMSLQILTGQTGFSSKLKQGNSLISGDRLETYFEEPASRFPFDWHKEFSEVFESPKGGFDIVVMNPPYNRLKPNLAEFLRSRLQTGKRDVHTEEYETHKWLMREDIGFYRKSGNYHYSNRHMINTYQLFIERALELARKDGCVAFVVPSTILGDVSSEGLRELLFTKNGVSSVYEFSEASSVFAGVTQSVTIMSVEKGGSTKRFSAAFNIPAFNLASKAKRTEISLSRMESIMGKSRRVPRLPASGWRILESLHKHPIISDIDDIEVWRGELDLTNHKTFIIEDPADAPLVRGSRIGRFKLVNLSNVSEYVNMPEFQAALQGSRRLKHMNQHRIAIQQISNMGQRWRLKAAHIRPSQVLANSCNYLAFGTKPTMNRINQFVGIFNSELLNWRFHLASYNNHVSIRELLSLPTVIPSKEKELELADLLASTVKGILRNERASTAEMESLVFALYGVGLKDASRILRMRKTPKQERTEILARLKSLIE